MESMQPPTDASFAGGQAASRERSNRVRFEEKQRRKNAPRACVICAARKVSCDVNRPCLRCVKAGKEHLCVDVETKRKRKPSHEDLEGDELAGNPSSPPGLAVTTRASARQLEATTRQDGLSGGESGASDVYNSLPLIADVALTDAAHPRGSGGGAYGSNDPRHNGLSLMMNAALGAEAGSAGQPPSPLNGWNSAAVAGTYDPDLDRCVNVSLWNTPIPVLRVVNSSPLHGPRKRSVFCNKAALDLFGFTQEGFNEFLTSGNTSQLIHPESLLDRITLDKECVSNRFNFARFDGRFLRQTRHNDGNTTFVPFRATEVINFSYDPHGVPFSILSYYVDIRNDQELSREWQQYLDGSKPVSPLAIATSSRVVPSSVEVGPSLGTSNSRSNPVQLVGLSSAPPQASTAVGVATTTTTTAADGVGDGVGGDPSDDVPKAVVTDVDQFWRKVYTDPLARTLGRVYDEYGTVLPPRVEQAMSYLTAEGKVGSSGDGTKAGCPDPFACAFSTAPAPVPPMSGCGTSGGGTKRSAEEAGLAPANFVPLSKVVNGASSPLSAPTSVSTSGSKASSPKLVPSVPSHAGRDAPRFRLSGSQNPSPLPPGPNSLGTPLASVSPGQQTPVTVPPPPNTPADAATGGGSNNLGGKSTPRQQAQFNPAIYHGAPLVASPHFVDPSGLYRHPVGTTSQGLPTPYGQYMGTPQSYPLLSPRFYPYVHSASASPFSPFPVDSFDWNTYGSYTPQGAQQHHHHQPHGFMPPPTPPQTAPPVPSFTSGDSAPS